MTTNNAVNTNLSGQTGTGNFVGSFSPSITTPNLIGVISGANPASGSIGQIISSHISSGSGVGLTTTVAANVTSISLTAGNWIIFGNVYFGNTMDFTICSAWLSTTSATPPDNSNTGGIGASVSVGNIGVTVPVLIQNVTTTTTIYLSCTATFSTGTVTASGNIVALRIS